MVTIETAAGGSDDLMGSAARILARLMSGAIRFHTKGVIGMAKQPKPKPGQLPKPGAGGPKIATPRVGGKPEHIRVKK